MKLYVEISGDQISEALRDMVETCFAGSLPTSTPISRSQMDDLARALDLLKAANEIIEYCGGMKIDLAELLPP